MGERGAVLCKPLFTSSSCRQDEGVQEVAIVREQHPCEGCSKELALDLRTEHGAARNLFEQLYLNDVLRFGVLLLGFEGTH